MYQSMSRLPLPRVTVCTTPEQGHEKGKKSVIEKHAQKAQPKNKNK